MGGSGAEEMEEGGEVEMDEGGDEEADRVQLWTSGNWHWYLKCEIRPPKGARRFVVVGWHPERPLELVLSTSGRSRIYFTSKAFINS